MDIFNEHFRFDMIAEVPIIVDHYGNILAHGEKLMNLTPQKMEDLASYLEGKVVYAKLRAEYTVPEVMLCTYRKCLRPSVKGTLRCDDTKHMENPDSPFNSSPFSN